MKHLIAALALLFVVGNAHAADKKADSTYTHVSADDVKFSPMDPKNPDGPLSLAVLNGDPQKGASDFLLKIKGGFNAGEHSHSAAYRAVVVKGQHVHWLEGKEADTKAAGPGSYWVQPAKQVHGDHCMGPEDCILAVHFDGKFDYVPSKADAKAQAKSDKKDETKKPEASK